jgi:hypothetical protein
MTCLLLIPNQFWILILDCIRNQRSDLKCTSRCIALTPDMSGMRVEACSGTVKTSEGSHIILRVCLAFFFDSEHGMA